MIRAFKYMQKSGYTPVWRSSMGYTIYGACSTYMNDGQLTRVVSKFWVWNIGYIGARLHWALCQPYLKLGVNPCSALRQPECYSTPQIFAGRRRTWSSSRTVKAAPVWSSRVQYIYVYLSIILPYRQPVF